MKKHRISLIIMQLLLLAGCAAKPSLRPPALDPASARSSESPVPPPPTINAPDPLLRIAAEPFDDPAAPGMQHDMHGMHNTPGMRHGEHDGTPALSTSPGQATSGFTCVMHPEVHADQPGRCPKCGMKLVPDNENTGGPK